MSYRVWYTPKEFTLNPYQTDDPSVKPEITSIRHTVETGWYIDTHRPIHNIKVTTYSQDGVIKEQILEYYHQDDPGQTKLWTEYRKEDFWPLST